jgi:hypothetical protein
MALAISGERQVTRPSMFEILGVQLMVLVAIR